MGERAEYVPYELMVKTNRYLIRGGELNSRQRQKIAAGLTAGRAGPGQAERFWAGVRSPGNTDPSGRRMYPEFFIPPWNGGKKYKTILNQTPKTHLFSANAYELEILRLLLLLSPEGPGVGEMARKTLERLKTTCFGNADDGVGECFDASLVALRFLAAAAPGESGWIKSRIENYNRHAGDKKRPWFALWYFWLCLSELPMEIAEPELLKYRDEMANWLSNKSCVLKSEHDREVHPVLFCILRNCLARLPGYGAIRDRLPYVSPKDGRLHFGMDGGKG